jgi:uncharacterized protein YuzE
MAKVKDIFDQVHSLKINPLDIDSIDQDKLWAHYDPEADSIVIYLTGGPVRAISVLVGDDIYLKVNPKTGDIVGFHIEVWERKFTPAHPEVHSIWRRLQPISEPALDWNYLLRMLALWVVFMLKSDASLSATPQPA